MRIKFGGKGMSDSTISLHTEGVDDNLNKITFNYNEII